MLIDEKEVNYFQYYNVDEIGKIFKWSGGIFRIVNLKFHNEVKHMFKCGLMDKLINNGYFVETHISKYHFETDDLILEHKVIDNITHKQEWTFDMIKDVSILILKINMICFEFGYELKDCHTANILFEGTIPKYIDFGSIVRRRTYGKLWMCKNEFLQTYFYPLSLRKKGFDNLMVNMNKINDILPLQELYYLNFRGIPKIFIILYDKFRLIIRELRYWIRSGNIEELVVTEEKNSFRKFTKKIVKNLNSIKFINDSNSIQSEKKAINDCQQLIQKLEKITIHKKESVWGEYQTNYYENNQKSEITRFSHIIESLKNISIKSSVEIGGNQGYFSKLLVQNNIVEKAIVSDYDYNAINILYNYTKIDKQLKNLIVPLVLNINSVSSKNQIKNRLDADIVIALALVHHLILTQGVNIDMLIEKLSWFTRKYILIEFMPMGLWNGKEEDIPTIPEWYNINWFRKKVSNKFIILQEKEVAKNRIMILGELK